MSGPQPLTLEQLAGMNGGSAAYATSGVMMANGFECGSYGLTKREYMATHLLAGIFANAKATTVDGYAQHLAIQHADLLLRQLEIPAPDLGGGT